MCKTHFYKSQEPQEISIRTSISKHLLSVIWRMQCEDNTKVFSRLSNTTLTVRNSKSHSVCVYNAQTQVRIFVDHCEVVHNLNFAYLLLYPEQIVFSHGNVIGVINNSSLKFGVEFAKQGTKNVGYQ